MDAKKRVLIVDDDTNVRLMLTTALTSVGYDVSEAFDGQAALARLEKGNETFDLVLLDLLMPRMDGMELLRRMRTAGISAPVVFLTAHGSITEAVAAMKMGAIDFLTKPITPEALRRTVADVIERQRVSPDITDPGKHESAVHADDSARIAFDLVRAKRAINRGQFGEAESILREVLKLRPLVPEPRQLLERLEAIKQEESRGSFRILRDWFPSGKIDRKKRP